MKGGGGEGMKAATNEGRESSVRVVLARGHVTSLERAGFFSLVIFRRFFYRWLIFVDFFFSGYDLKSAGAGGGLGTWFFRLVAGQREVGGGTKICTKKTV